MHKTKKRLTGIAVSAMMLLAVSLPVSPQRTGETGFTLIASAADNTSDMVQHPEKYFTFSNNPERPGTYQIESYDGTDTVIRIPGTINGKIVTKICGSMRTPFITNQSVRDSITSVTIDYRVMKIEGFAFNSCKNLRTVTLPSSIMEIQDNAFSNCKRLQKVSMSNYLPNISDRAFTECPLLTDTSTVNGAKTLLKGGANNLYTINGSQIAYYCGPTQKPYLNPSIEPFVMECYDKLDNTTLIKDYEQWYASYIVFGRLGINGSMSDTEKAAKIFIDMKNRVSYDKKAWGPRYDDYNHIIAYTAEEGYDAGKAHVAGSALWGTKTVCEGYAEALSLLFSAAGLENHLAETFSYKSVYKDGSYVDEESHHEFNVVRIDSAYYVIDATENFTTGFMIPGEKHRLRRNLQPLDTWNYFDYRLPDFYAPTQYAYLAYSLNSEFGDLNKDGKVNRTDSDLQSAYFRGTQAQKNAILNQCGCTKRWFEEQADADFNGKLESSKDGPALWARYQAGLDCGYV